MPLDDKGREIPDPTPIVINIKQRRISKFDDVRSFIRRELSDAAERGGMESIDEANDFDIDDDPVDPTTPWEEWGDRQAEIDQAIAREKAQDKAYEAKRKAAIARRTAQGNTPSNTDEEPPPPSKSKPSSKTTTEGKPDDSSPT